MIYTSPTLHYFYMKKAHLLYKPLIIRSILSKLTYWERTHTQELPNQLILQTGHRNAQAKMHPELQMQHKVAGGLAAQTCQFDKPCTNLAWCSSQVNLFAKWFHLIKPPQEFTKQLSKLFFCDTRSWHNTARGQFHPLKQDASRSISIVEC